MTDSDFRAIFDQYKDTVYRFAWRMTNSPTAAEDIAQEVFLSLLRYPDRFDPTRGAFRPFLLAVARNLALKRYRDEDRWDVLEDEHFHAPPFDIERGETGMIVGEAVNSLPPLQREVLILAEYEDLSLEEIARTVDSEIGTVKSRLYRARENLRRMLAPLKQERSTYGTSK
jgi:RNA polymerase sigma-70 factor (ECF subfamily)